MARRRGIVPRTTIQQARIQGEAPEVGSSWVPLLPVAERRALRAEMVASFRVFAETVFRLRPRLRSVAFQIRRGFEGIEFGLRYACDPTPPAEHRCGDSRTFCDKCEVWDDFLPWTSWLKDWSGRSGNAEAFLAYCDCGTFTTYAIARRRRFFRAVDIEVVAQLREPWFEPDDAIDQVVPLAPGLRPWFDAVYRSPADPASRRAVAERMVALGDSRGAYILEQLVAGRLDWGETSLLREHFAEWLGPLGIAAAQAGSAFHAGFPLVLQVCFASDAAVTACAEAPAWATVEQLELLDPRDYPVRPGVFIEDRQPITSAMKSLQMLSGVRSSGLRSLEALTISLPLWHLEVKLASTEDLERLLRLECLPALTCLTLVFEFAFLPEDSVWERLWARAPWCQTLSDLTVQVIAHLERWSLARARLGVTLIQRDSGGCLELMADSRGEFTHARFHTWTGAVERPPKLLSEILTIKELKIVPLSRVSLSENDRAVAAENVARLRPDITVVF